MQIKTKYGAVEVEVLYAKGQLAIHEAYKDTGYTLTHIPTGRYVVASQPSVEDLIAVAEELYRADLMWRDPDSKIDGKVARMQIKSVLKC